jgi:hypothetical protein
MFACRRRPAPVLFGALAALLLLSPAAARADAPPSFNGRPSVEGNAVVGSTLTVVASWTGDPAPSVKYRWGRCPATGTTCTPIKGAKEATYVVTVADLGYRLAAELTLANGPGKVTMTTLPTSHVVDAPAADQSPGSSTEPEPPLATAAPPAPAPVTISQSAASLVGPPARAFLKPFPVIRIRGFFAQRGARITLLSVRGPRLAKVDVRCSGGGCPVRALSLPTADTRVHPFERFLRAGMLLQIRVTQPGRIGTYTSFLIRSRKSPLRTDRCLSVKTGKPIKCAAP